MACREEQIPEIGDWIEYENVGKSVIIVRTKTGVKAFNNACRHRGVPFAGGSPLGSSHATAHGNCAKSGFVCPFHGWRWNMDGENTLVYGKHLFSDRQIDEDDINLIPCRAEVYGGCVWINHDNDAPSVRESLGPVADRLEAHNLHKLRAEWCYGTVLPANWKIAMEAFMEGYHVMQTHPSSSLPCQPCTTACTRWPTIRNAIRRWRIPASPSRKTSRRRSATWNCSAKAWRECSTARKWKSRDRSSTPRRGYPRTRARP
ncbi:aromatic ring-hydroxylating dioxygenase subunit alpha [Novosphingobium panipatense]